MPRLHLGDWVDSGVDWLVAHMGWLFDAIKAVVEGMYDGVNAVLTAPEPLLLASAAETARIAPPPTRLGRIARHSRHGRGGARIFYALPRGAGGC